MTQSPMSQSPMSQSPMSQSPMSQSPMSQPPMAQSPPVDSDARELPKRVVIPATVILLASFMLNAMDRQVFSPLLPEIRTDLGFSLSEGGLLATGFTLGMAVAGIPAGYLVDRLSRKSILQLSILVYSLGTVAIALSAGFFDMAVYRLVSGLGEGVQATAVFAVVCSYFHVRRALAAGAVGASFGVGVFLGPMFGTWMAIAADSWRVPFVVFGTCGLAIILLIAFLVPRRMSEAPGVPAPDGSAVASFDHVPASPWNRNVIALGVASAVGGVVTYGFLGLYPTFLREELGFSPVDTAFAVSMFGGGSILSLLAGWVGDRVDQRKLLLFTFTAVIAVSWFLFRGPTTPLPIYLLSFLMGTFSSGFVYTNCNSAMQRAVRPDQVGRGIGAFMASYYVAAAFSGLLLAQLVGALGWTTAGLLQFTLLPLVAIAALLVVDTRRFSNARPAPADPATTAADA